MKIEQIVKRSIMLFKTASGPSSEEYEKIVKITMALSLAIGLLGVFLHFALNII